MKNTTRSVAMPLPDAVRVSSTFLFLLLAAAVLSAPARAQTLTTLHSFGASTTDGSYPASALVQGTDGSFYGTTAEGGQYGRQRMAGEIVFYPA